MVIQHNIAALYGSRQFGINDKNRMKAAEKLGSGYRINRAADDAARLSISEKMRAQVRGLDAAGNNVKEGSLYCNVAEGALGEVHSMLDRIKELSVQAANDTNTVEDREVLDQEVQQLKQEVTSIFRNTEFNSIKVWQAAYVPEVGGVCNDFRLYNVEDATGSYHGGIIYMNHRYSWEDLGMTTNWDSTNHVFTSDAIFTVNADLLHNNGNDTGDSSINDNYISSGNTGALFTIHTTEGGTVAGIEKSYDWKADNTGIYINNVMTMGVPHSEEGNTTWAAMGLTSGQYVPGGTYTFMYYGMEVSFEVPAEGDEWADFLGGINNTLIHIDWHSEYDRTYQLQAVEFQNNNSISIDNSNKDYIAAGLDAYTVEADEDGIWLINNSTAKEQLGKTDVSGVKGSLIRWEDLYNHEGYPITSWGLDEDGSHSTDSNGMVISDGGDTKVTLSDAAAYTYTGSPLGASFSLDFKLLMEVSRGAVIRDIDGSTLSGGVVSPVAITSFSSGSSSFISTGVSASISFLTQRDQLNRDFLSPTEEIALGALSVNGTGEFQLTLTEAGGGAAYTLTSSQKYSDLITEVSDKIINSTRDIYYAAVTAGTTPNPATKLGLGEYTFTFRNGNDRIDVKMDLSNIKYSDLVSSSSTPYDSGFSAAVATYVQNGMTDFLDSALTVSGNGATYQMLELNEKSVKDNVAVNAPIVRGYDLSLNIQAGANENQNIEVSYDYLRLGSLGIKTANVLTREDAQNTIASVDRAIEKVSEQRIVFGSYMNRFEHAGMINANTSENLQAAESGIRDADIAEEMVIFSRSNILTQVTQAVLAQANQSAQGVLQLLK